LINKILLTTAIFVLDGKSPYYKCPTISEAIKDSRAGWVIWTWGGGPVSPHKKKITIRWQITKFTLKIRFVVVGKFELESAF